MREKCVLSFLRFWSLHLTCHGDLSKLDGIHDFADRCSAFLRQKVTWSKTLWGIIWYHAIYAMHCDAFKT